MKKTLYFSRPDSVIPSPSVKTRLCSLVRVAALVGAATTVLTSPALAQNVWDGQQNTLGLWSDKTQWTLGTVPDGSTDIVIPVRTVLGDVSFTNSHTLTIGTAGELNILSATTIANAHSTATINNFGTLVNNGVLINELGATLNNNSTGTLINNGVISNQLMGSMINAGFLQNMNGGFITNDLSSTITNSGTWVNYSGATLSNFGSISSTGLLQSLAGGTIDNFGMISSGPHTYLDIQGTLNNSGAIVAGLFSNSGTTNNSGMMTLNAGDSFTQNLGVFNNQATGQLVNNTTFITFDGGILNNHGTITSTELLQTMGTGTINNFGTINSGPNVYLDNQGTLNNSGTIVAGLFSNSGTTNNSGMITLNAGNFFSQNLGVFNNQATGQLVNNTTFITFDGGILNNHGTITNTGIFQTLATGTINNFGTINSGASALLDIQGTLNNSGTIVTGLFNTEGTTNNSGKMTINGGSVFSQNLGVLNNVAGGQLINNTTLINFSGATLNNAGKLTNNGVFENQAAGTLANTGLLNNAGTLANSGLFQIGSGGILNNTGSIGNTSGGGFVVQGGGTLNNSGSFLSDSFSAFGSQTGSTILNTGTMALGGNTVAIGGDLKNNGTITMVVPPAIGDPPIQLPAPPLLVTSTGKLSGTGTVNAGLLGTGVIMEGVMSPGDPGGAFTINGTYRQTSTGTLDILLGGTGAGQFGQLDINGIADLSGTLDVELFAGFDPQAGETFEILRSGGITNLDFMSMLFPTLPDDLFFKLDQEGNNLFLDVSQGGGTPTPEPGTGMLLVGAFAVVFVGSRFRKRLLVQES